MNDPQADLLHDHAEAERLLGLVEKSIEGEDCCEDLRAVWSQLETMLVDHMRTEERSLFGLVADHHREEVERLRAEHVQIHGALTRLGIELELHSLRKPEVEALIAPVREHAARENRTLYCWRTERPGPGFQSAVQRMLHERLRHAEAKTAAR